MTVNTIKTFALDLLNRVSLDRRYFIGIVGVPAAGKSTFSRKLSTTINVEAQANLSIVVPMDGFHYYDKILRKKGLYELKGIPETFDAISFVNILNKLHFSLEETVKCPEFNRDTNEPTQDAILVNPTHKIIIVEGNYLLLKVPPWNLVQPLLNEVWFIDTPIEDTRERLLMRHVNCGLSLEQANIKMQSTDIPNAELIIKYRQYANKIIVPVNGNYEDG